MSWFIADPSYLPSFRSSIITGLVAAAFVFAANSLAEADFIDPSFLGSTSYDEWTLPGLSAESNPGYPTAGTYTNLWPSPIGSTLGGDAQLDKTSGGGYPLGASGGGGIYTFFAGGNFKVFDASPVAGLQTVLLQLEVPSNPLTAGPVLDYNAGSESLAPTTTVDRGEGFMLYQWDLTSAGGSITDFSIGFGLGMQHSQIAGIQLDQSSVMTPVPEPLAGVLLGIGGAVALFSRRRFSRR